MAPINLQPAFVLHHRPYRDTSRILELLTRDHGRVAVFARSARGGLNKSAALIPVVQPFNRLLVSWSGRGEAGQLTAAEFDGACAALPPDRLVSGYYLNELLLKLLARHDSHPEVFALYAATIATLKQPAAAVAPLRVFEKRLLEALGYGLALEKTANGQPIDANTTYHYRLEHGALSAGSVVEGDLIFPGSSLLALAREALDDPVSSADARRLLRAALERCLDGRELQTRKVMLALRRGKS